jgi:hypothetical protein
MLTSVSLWRVVVRDLLDVSSSTALSHSLERQSAQSLRTKALRFLHVDRALSARTALLLGTPMLDQASMRGMGMLPGTGCYVFLSPTGSVHVVRMATEQTLDIWAPVQAWGEPNTPSLIFVGTSSTHGLVVITGCPAKSMYVSCRDPRLHLR